jgi:hypothetical protein
VNAALCDLKIDPQFGSSELWILSLRISHDCFNRCKWIGLDRLIGLIASVARMDAMLPLAGSDKLTQDNYANDDAEGAEPAAYKADLRKRKCSIFNQI